MAKYLIRRAIFVLAAFACATVIMFAISRMGGAHTTFTIVRGLCGCYGVSEEGYAFMEALERPTAVQYLEWGKDVAQGDFGRTALAERPVADVIQETGGNTVKLVLGGWLFAIIVGVSLGVLSAVNRARIWGFIGGVISLFGRAMPAFLVGAALILLFAATWEIFPKPLEYWSAKHFVLPAIAAGLGAAAGYFSATRSAAREALSSDFFRLARGKGAGKSAAARKYALKKALIPTLAVSSLLTAALINGAIVVEVVFGLPGLGRVAVVEAVNNHDFHLLLGAVFVFTAIYLTMNFAADALRAWADPRIRYS